MVSDAVPEPWRSTPVRGPGGTARDPHRGPVGRRRVPVHGVEFDPRRQCVPLVAGLDARHLARSPARARDPLDQGEQFEGRGHGAWPGFVAANRRGRMRRPYRGTDRTRSPNEVSTRPSDPATTKFWARAPPVCASASMINEAVVADHLDALLFGVDERTTDPGLASVGPRQRRLGAGVDAGRVPQRRGVDHVGISAPHLDDRPRQ